VLSELLGAGLIEPVHLGEVLESLRAVSADLRETEVPGRVTRGTQDPNTRECRNALRLVISPQLVTPLIPAPRGGEPARGTGVPRGL